MLIPPIPMLIPLSAAFYSRCRRISGTEEMAFAVEGSGSMSMHSEVQVVHRTAIPPLAKRGPEANTKVCVPICDQIAVD